MVPPPGVVFGPDSADVVTLRDIVHAEVQAQPTAGLLSLFHHMCSSCEPTPGFSDEDPNTQGKRPEDTHWKSHHASADKRDQVAHQQTKGTKPTSTGHSCHNHTQSCHRPKSATQMACAHDHQTQHAHICVRGKGIDPGKLGFSDGKHDAAKHGGKGLQDGHAAESAAAAKKDQVIYEVAPAC